MSSEEQPNPKMKSNPSNTTISRWPDLPTDVLTSIADHLHPKIGTLRLRSVCKSWRSSLSLFSSSSSSSSSLTLPFPTQALSPLSPPPPHLTLLQQSLYLLTPKSNPSNGFLLKVQETKANTFSVIDPLMGNKCKPISDINVLEYGLVLVCENHVFGDVGFGFSRVPFKKVVVCKGFSEEGDFVVLGLSDTRDLWVWRFGDDNWTEIYANGRWFDDIVSFNGKFYASADRRGRLVMIDSRLKPIDLVHSLIYGCGNFTHLVVCDEGLYLIDRHFNNQGVGLGVFKLDEKGRFWDYELHLNGGVFFIGNDANFAVSRKEYGGCIRDCIYFVRISEEGDGYHAVYDVKKNTVCSLVESQQFGELYGPPSFDAVAMDYTS